MLGQLSNLVLAGRLVRLLLLENELLSFPIFPSVLMPVILSVYFGTTNRSYLFPRHFSVWIGKGLKYERNAKEIEKQINE